MAPHAYTIRCSTVESIMLSQPPRHLAHVPVHLIDVIILVCLGHILVDYNMDMVKVHFIKFLPAEKYTVVILCAYSMMAHAICV